MKRRWKRLLSIALASVMTFTMTGVSALADTVEEAPIIESADPESEDPGNGQGNGDILEERVVVPQLGEGQAGNGPTYVYFNPDPNTQETGVCFFANGTPIILSAREDGEEGAIITWDGGSMVVGSLTNVFGGSHDSDTVLETTSVTVNGGTVNSVFGGGLHKSHVKKANVTINAGAVIGQVCGGGASSLIKADVEKTFRTDVDETGANTACSHGFYNGTAVESPCKVDEANLTINGGTFPLVNNLIFGGGEGISCTGTANTTISGGTFYNNTYVTAGGSNGYTGTGNLMITDLDGESAPLTVVQGANRGSMQDIHIKVNGGAISSLYAGGETADKNVTATFNTSTVEVSGSAMVTEMFPGSNGNSTTNVSPDSTSIAVEYEPNCVTAANAELFGTSAKPYIAYVDTGDNVQEYTSIEDAVAGADGEIISVTRSISDPITLGDALGATIHLEANPRYQGSPVVLSGGVTNTADDGANKISSCILSGFTFNGKPLDGTWTAADTETSMFKVENCVFDGVTPKSYKQGPLVISGFDGMVYVLHNKITNVVDQPKTESGTNYKQSTGITTWNCDSITVSGNTLSGISGTPINLNFCTGDVVVTENTINDWGHGTEPEETKSVGRAARISASGDGTKSLRFERNVMNRDGLSEESFVKISGYTSDDRMNAGKNYWAGYDPSYTNVPDEENTLLIEEIDKEGTPSAWFLSYYTDPELTDLIGVPYVCLTDRKLNLTSGDSVKLSLEQPDGEEIPTELLWESSNPNLASVDREGRVTAGNIQEGQTATVKITVKAANRPGASDVCEVTVAPKKELGTGTKIVQETLDDSVQTEVAGVINRDKELAAAFIDKDEVVYADIKVVETEAPETEVEVDHPIRFTIAYPEEAGITAGNYKEYTFAVLHVIDTSTTNGSPANAELLYYKATKDGLEVTSNGLSPFAIGYRKLEDSELSAITFDSQGGTVVAGQKAAAKVVLEEPAKPVRSGYTFTGWYTDAACTYAWDFAKDSVPGNLTLYAGWSANAVVNTYTVTFDSQGGTTVNDMAVTSGGKVIKPSDPARDGYTFAGWYKDAAGTTAWDFAKDTVSANTTLYAKWIPAQEELCTVSFNSQGGSDVASVKDVKAGSLLAKPADPQKDFYNFTGWYKDAAGTAAWDFAKDAVTGNMTLYAGWKPYKPATPEVTAVKTNTTAVKLTWAKIPKVTGYVIYGYTGNSKDYDSRKVIVGASKNSYLQTGLKPGTQRRYIVRAYKKLEGKNYYSGMSKVTVTATKPQAAVIKSITPGKGTARVTLTKKPAGAVGYAYCTSTNNETFRIVAKGPKMPYTMKGLKKGTNYIKVRSYVRDSNGKTVYGNWSKTVKVNVK